MMKLFSGFIPATRPKRHQGFTLLETVFALTIFTMMALLFSAVLPVSQRAARSNAEYAQAAALIQHKIAQMRAAGFPSLQNPVALAALGIIDSGSATSQAVPYTASFLASDHLADGTAGSGLFPAAATATICVTDYSSLNAAVPAGTVDNVTVTLSWPNANSAGGTYTMSCLIIQMPHS